MYTYTGVAADIPAFQAMQPSVGISAEHYNYHTLANHQLPFATNVSRTVLVTVKE